MTMRSQELRTRDATFWSVALAFFITMLGTTLPTPLYVLYQGQLGFSTLATTLIFAAYGAGILVTLVLFGRASDVLGRRRPLLAGLACSMLSALVFFDARDVSSLILGRLLSGMSAGLFTSTATATLVDVAGEGRGERATLAATVANMSGLGCGPLIAGLLVKFAPGPLHTPFALHAALLCVATIGVWAMPETMAPHEQVRFRVMLPGVPVSMRSTFVRAAAAGFAGFAVLGLFAAVLPSILRGPLGISDPALAGSVVCAVFAASALGQITAVPRLGRFALPVGCAVLAAGMTILALGLWLGSVALLATAAITAGIGQGISFRAGLGAINAEAPTARRAETISAFFFVVYVAISLPVIGVGLGADAWGLRTASIGFSVAAAAMAAAVLLSLLR